MNNKNILGIIIPRKDSKLYKKYKDFFQSYRLRHYFKILFYIKIICLISNIIIYLSSTKTWKDLDLKVL